MPNGIPYRTGFVVDGGDLGSQLIEKDYFYTVYNYLLPQLKQPSTMWLWGCNSSGQLGAGNVINQLSPVQTISGGSGWCDVSIGSQHAAAIKTDGTLWVWGNNTCGKLGNNSTINSSSPVQTSCGGTNWKSLSVGCLHTAAIKTDGTLWLWGCGLTGILGNNALTSVSNPVQTSSGGTNWKQVSVNDNHSAAVKTDGTLWTWGSAACGALGNSSTILCRSTPTQTVSATTDWTQVSVGQRITAAVKTDGTLWTWGDNQDGALGNNSTIDQSSPVQTVAGGTNWKQVSAGGGITSAYVTAIKNDGTLWTWGSNSCGRLGNNNFNSRSSPVQTVSTGTNWRCVSAGSLNTAAIKTDGTLWVWGVTCALGVGCGDSISSSTSPVQTILSNCINWRNISAGCLVMAGIEETGDF